MQRGEGGTRERPGIRRVHLIGAIALLALLCASAPLAAQESGAERVARSGLVDVADAPSEAPARLRVRDLHASHTAASDLKMPDGEESGPGFFGRYLQVLAWLAALLAAAGGVFLLVRKGSAVGRSLRPANRFLEVVTRVNVGPKHSLAIVRAGNRLLLIGFAPDTIQSLGEITEAAAVVQATQGTNFQERLREADGDEAMLKETSPPSAPEADWVAPYRREVDRLKGMLSQWRATGAHAGGEA